MLCKIHVNFKSSNKYLQIFQQLKVPTDIYKSSNNITVPTEIYKSSNNKNCTNRNLQIFQQISTNLPTIECTNRNLQIFQQISTILLQRGNAAILGNRIPNFPP